MSVPAYARSMTLSSAANSGNRLDTLTELRDDLAARLEVCQSDQNYSTMGRLLTDVLLQIEVERGAKTTTEGTALDELARRRTVAGRPDATSKAGSSSKAK